MKKVFSFIVNGVIAKDTLCDVCNKPIDLTIPFSRAVEITVKEIIGQTTYFPSYIKPKYVHQGVCEDMAILQASNDV